MKLSKISEICDGKLFGNGNREIETFFLDSRQSTKNAMFVPIVGEKVDAHSFIDTVFDSGSASFSQNVIENPKGDYVLVEDSVKALQEVALYHRNSLEIPVVAVTGSVGKTTTKEMLALTLESSLKTLKTLGNANSQVGLPLTLMRINEKHECAVIEMGMSLPGEMERIAYSARPDIAVITNIGVSHIEFHGTREKIMEEKLHIADYFTSENILLVNGDDDLLCTLKDEKKYRVIQFGLGENCDYKAVNLTQNADGSRFICKTKDSETELYIPAPGIHNVQNALACFAVAELLDIDRKKAVIALSEYKAPDMRQQIKSTKMLTLIDDTYNASPDSMKSAIDVLSALEGNKKIAVLADMLELGDYSEKGHKDVGAYASKMGVDYLIAFGKESESIFIGFDDSENSSHFLHYEEAENCLRNRISKDDVILVKGSRGMKTDRFIKFLEELG